MKLRKILTLATAGTAAASISLFGLGVPAAHADADQPITFEVTANGSLAIDQTPTTSLLIQGTAVNMPSTTVTDGRNAASRSGAWAVTATASALVSDDGGTNEATIAANQITLAESGSFSTGTGTRVGKSPIVATGNLVSATGDSIDSVYTYTPTATLAAQTLPYAGSYSGNVTQTVV